MNTESILKIGLGLLTAAASVGSVVSKNDDSPAHEQAPITTVAATTTTTLQPTPTTIWISYDPSKPPTYDPRVEDVQRRLKNLGYSVTVDGIYGPVTEQAVRTFQRQNHLTVDGIVGPTTMRMLTAASP